VVGEQVGVQFGGELAVNSLPHQFVGPGGVERLRQAHVHHEAIDGLPGPRLVPQQGEFNRQAIQVRRDEGVDAPGVGLEHLPVFGAHLGHRAFANAAEAEGAILDVKP